jgi:hypothetical protein
MKTSHSFVSQHNFKQAPADETSKSFKNCAPIAFDSSVRMIVDEWMSNRSGKSINGFNQVAQHPVNDHGKAEKTSMSLD